MKRCPTCQQMFPDNAPPQCPYDGTYLVAEAPPQQPYYGSNQPPYGQPADPAQWQPPGGGGGYYQQPGGYPPPPPAYGGQYAPTGGSKALSTAAFACGLGAFLILVFVIFVFVMAKNGSMSFDTLLFLAQIIQPLSWLMLLSAVASIVLGIVALVTSGRNPAISKPKAIVGMCLGAIPLILFLIGLANMPGR
ncbi:MAG TPA: hypothetical protein VN256_06760 [Pyrinomonadaceae bacterium]|nr:hypothetical protein [Pyrinomonadaceae bacterium]